MIIAPIAERRALTRCELACRMLYHPSSAASVDVDWFIAKADVPLNRTNGNSRRVFLFCSEEASEVLSEEVAKEVPEDVSEEAPKDVSEVATEEAADVVSEELTKEAADDVFRGCLR